MWTLAALILTALHLHASNGQLKVPKEPNVLTPPYFNIATGKKIQSTATCGEDKEQIFCKLTGGPNEYAYNENLHRGLFCDVCDANDPAKSHPIKYAIDGTEKWWQSPPLSEGQQYNEINITIHLGQVFHVAYVIIKFANSPRAGTWVLERSSDHGETFQPWQYFANSDSDCHTLFGIDAFEDITSDNSVICTSEYSDVVPLERGEVIVSMINHRPGAKNFSHSPVLQEWSKATDIRLRLLRTKTLLGHLMAVQRQDPTVTRRYFYSVKDISVGGRCVCNGHADTCVPDPFDRYKLKCECRHNTCGDSCEYCCPGFEQKAWRAAVPESANECEQCNCFGHSTECLYDEQVAIRRQSLDLAGNYEGGGVCQNCTHNTAGINCETCVDGYYRPANIDPRDPNGCRPCDCDSAFTVGTCEPETGRCYCKPKYAGDRCDRCAPGYHQFPECEPCPCYYNGTRDGVCLPVDEVCPCKYNFAGKHCDQCAAGFYNFPECAPCTCTGQGAISAVCDVHDGQCECEEGFGGLSCDQCSPGYYNYPICQACSCFTTFTTAEVCDPINGRCFCTDPVTGPSCNRCKEGFYDFPQCKECECDSPGSASSLCDSVSGKCQCKPNFRGQRCDECAPEYYDYPNCVPCDCDTQGSQRTTCDPDTGDCACFENIEGRRCDQCAPEYFNFPRCEDCKCNVLGIESFVPGVCLAFTTGQCDCKENVVGIYCDTCAPLHYNLTLGCIDCNCLLEGTLDGVAGCDSENGDCWCKPYTCTQRCSQCDEGFFNLEERNYFGCSGCRCSAGGSMSQNCELADGQCPCKEGVTGRKCDTVKEGYYYPDLLQHKYEVEDGRTTDEKILRFGFDTEKFPSFSMRGYGEFSVVQRVIIVRVNVESYGLYRIQFSYIDRESTSFANVTVTPVTASGSEQEFKVNFEQTAAPTLLSGQVVVLNEGEWDVTIEGDPGLLIDYIVLLPSQYYEPSIFQAKVTEPCQPSLTLTGKECLMYDHLPLKDYPQESAVDFADFAQHDAPSTAHPTMVYLDGNSVVDDHKTINVAMSGVPGPGKYVLVIEYASSEDHMQTIEGRVFDGAGREYTDVKFNIYSCLYSFLCRQVALTTLSDVKVFDMSVANINVELRADAGEAVYVRKIYAIPYDKWTMEYVEPKRLCITKEGPSFDECVSGVYPIPSQAIKYDVGDNDNQTRPGGPDAANPDVLDIGSDRNPITINMDLKPGRYVFLLHYLNPDHTSFSPDVVISDGIVHVGSANVTFCPSPDGCRAVVVTDAGAFVLDITSPTQTMTITVPPGKNLLLDYVLAIPEDAYNAAILDVLPLDFSRRYFEECYHVGTEGTLESNDDLSEFCQSAIFSLTMDFNDGALPCDCSGEGTVGGADADCQDYGGQCPCKPNVIGRKCEKCKTGYFGYPDCQPCNCNGSLCDEINGNCICPPNTVTPGCDRCQPFTHSFHPLVGCEHCDCHPDGVENAEDLGCSQEDGQCRCKENVEGLHCDRCKQGYFGFPDCRPCICDERGRKQDGCDSDSGQCICKDNVEGQQCDRCKAGTFHLDINNPLGCTACFCFGVTTDCSATRYPLKEITDMDGWRLLNTKNDEPKVTRVDDTVSVDIVENGGAKDQAVLYWAAPKPYLEQKIGSYGGELRFSTSTQRETAEGGRGDSTTGNGDLPAPLTSLAPTVILEEGRGLVIEWTNRDRESSEQVVKLIESNFVHKESGGPVKREEMMLVLEGLQSLRIKATDYPNSLSVSLTGVSMTTTDYEADRGSGEVIPTVEICRCPPGYVGNSCEMCDIGHYRDNTGPYLGYCTQCDCYGHCDSCTSSGLTDRCKHHTAGENCQLCEDGYIGNATSGDPDACQPCPCPFPTVEGNFATKCEYDEENNVICHCQPGYTGEKCDQCASGYFGNPSVIGGECRACNCHGNLDVNLIMEICDPVTGECAGCQDNTGGKYCERCADGFYGDAITAKNCTKCPCNECGTLQCDDINGYCACKDHVIGFSCDRCEPGYWNHDTCTGCLSCGCDIGALDYECDAISGQCHCAPNVIGRKCDKCAPGHWDYSTRGCQPCNCRNDGDCNPVNGECTCPPGITGPQCDQCKLDRHILPPGGLECESCDSCTHDLLDAIEPMSGKVRESTKRLSNVSAGVAAAKRLQTLQEQGNSLTNEVDNAKQRIDEIGSEADDLLRTDLEVLDSAGSGDLMAGSGDAPAPLVDLLDYGEADKDAYSALEDQIEKTEEAVAAMCNKSQTILEDVTDSNNKVTALDSNATALADGVDDFTTEAEDLLSKLEEESDGDSEQYLANLANAKMLITKMNERVFGPMKQIADKELGEAQELFGQVNFKFVLPADDLQERYDAVSNDLTRKSDKMKEMRKRLNNASLTVTDIDSLNAANLKALGAAKDALDGITTEWDTINDMIKDTKSTIDSGEGTQVLDTEQLRTVTEQLEAEYDSHVAGLEGMYDLVNQSVAHANTLKHDADELEKLVNKTENDPRNIRAVEAANRYRNIINVISEAEKAANNADLAATEAQADVLSKDLETAAEKAHQESGTLLNRVQTTLNTDIKRLTTDLESARASKDGIDQLLRDSTTKLDSIDSSISNLSPGDVDTNVLETKEKAREAMSISDDVMMKAKELEKQVDAAPDPDIDVEAEVADVETKITEVENGLEEAEDKVADVTETADRVAMLSGQLGLDDKISEIKKLIELARGRADVVSVSMEFKKKTLKEGIYSEYAQVHIPQQAFELNDHTNVEVYVNVSKSEDNSLLYLGSADSGDYVALETIGGKVYYYYKAGDGVGELVSDVAINDQHWHRILIERDGTTAKLTVDYPNTAECRGDDDCDGTPLSDVKTANIDGSNVEANLPMSSTPLVIGGMPFDPLPGQLKRNQMNGCLKDLNVNGEGVGIWNFVSYNGPLPGSTCAYPSSEYGTDLSWWRFRGVDSYVRITEDEIKGLGYYSVNNVIRYIGFKFVTQERDQLLFFVGSSVDQFYALEVKDGKLVLTYNFGFDEPRSEVGVGVNDVSSIEQPLLVKFGLIPQTPVTADPTLIVLIVNNQAIIRLPRKADWNIKVMGDVWIGGVYDSHKFEGVSDAVVNLNNNFRGCMRDLKFHLIRNTFQIYNAKERVGVTKGCERSDVPAIDDRDKIHISVDVDYPNIGKTDKLVAENETTTSTTTTTTTTTVKPTTTVSTTTPSPVVTTTTEESPPKEPDGEQV